MKFDDRPDYGFLRRLFKTVFERERIESDNEYDFVIELPTSLKKNTKIEDKANYEEREKKESNNIGSNNITTTKNTSNQKINSYKGKIYFNATIETKDNKDTNKNARYLKK